MKFLFVVVFLMSSVSFAQWAPEISCKLTKDLAAGAIYALPELPAGSEIGFYKYSDSRDGEILVVGADGKSPLAKRYIVNVTWVETPTDGLALKFMNANVIGGSEPRIQYVVSVGNQVSAGSSVYVGGLFKADVTGTAFTPVADGLQCASRYFKK